MNFYRLTSIFAVLALTSFVSPQSNEKEKLQWNEDRKLTWADFKGEPKGWEDYVASTNSGISFSYSYRVVDGELDLTYTIKTNFYPNLSWFVPNHVDDYILRHEQAHFDVSELHARKLRKRLSETRFSLYPKTEIENIYRYIEEERQAMQEQFDLESDHSKIKSGEKKWEAFISEELARYAQWK